MCETTLRMAQTLNQAKETLFVHYLTCHAARSIRLRHPAAIHQRHAVLVLPELTLKMRR